MAGGEANREMACESEARRATTAARTEGAAASSPELAVAPRRRLAARQRLAVAVGVLSVALIAVSAAFLLPSAEQPALTGAAPAAPLPGGSSVSSQGEAGEADGAEPASDDAASSPDGGAASEGAASAAPFDAGADGAGRAGGAGAPEGLPEPDPTPVSYTHLNPRALPFRPLPHVRHARRGRAFPRVSPFDPPFIRPQSSAMRSASRRCFLRTVARTEGGRALLAKMAGATPFRADFVLWAPWHPPQPCYT